MWWKSLADRGFAHGLELRPPVLANLRNEPWFGTLPTLVAAATATSTLRLGTWVMSPTTVIR